MAGVPKGPIVGLTELADLLGVVKQTPHAWQYRGVLPKPDFDPINGGKAWRRETILLWAAARPQVLEKAPATVAQEARRLAKAKATAA